MQNPRSHVALALLLVALGTARIVSTFTVFSHTIDEPDNLASGLEYWTTGRYLYDEVNPPLARIFIAAGPFFAGERFHRGPEVAREGVRILGSGAHYDRILALARAGILPFFWIASAVVFLWARRIGGPWAALGAVALFTTTPAILGLSGIANTDMGLCAMAGVATLLAMRWAEAPTRNRSIALGVGLALACVTKFSAVPFLAAGWTLMLLVAGRRPDLRGKGRAVAIVLGTAALTVWAAYGFSFARVGILHNLRVPAPRLFTGLDLLLHHQNSGHPAYLLGQRSSSGFWWYFPVDLGVKTPISMLILAILALFWRRKQVALPLAFAAGVLLASLTSHVNLGVRYILPVYLGLCTAGGCMLATRRIPVLLLLGWQIVSGALQHPDYLAYTNEIAGSHPERFVADSDLDWGQDMKRLAAFLQANGIERLTFRPFVETYKLPVEVAPGEADRPSPGWNAVSVTLWKSFGDPPWADRMRPPDQRIGRGILLWYIQPEEVARVAVADVLDHRPDQRVVVRDLP